MLLKHPFFFVLLATAQEIQAKQFYILTSPYTGFFSCFQMATGFLGLYEQNKNSWAGVKINFNEGLYLDKTKGDNWWDYYFEPINIGIEANSEPAAISDELRGNLAGEAINQKNRLRTHRIIKKYIKVKAHINQIVQDYIRANFTNYFIIGIHYRGTDKVTEAPRIPYEFVAQQVVATLDRFKQKSCKIFIATDEQNFIDFMQSKFDTIIYRDVIRSVDGKEIHWNQPNPYQQGEESLIDCLLLSKCNILLRTESNLGASAGTFNPKLRIINLTSTYINRNDK